LAGYRATLIDLEPAVRDAVVLALPANPLCREDCPGLCARVRAAPRRPAGPTTTHEQVDARWAALSKLNIEE
jgi:uncharacterized protein